MKSPISKSSLQISDVAPRDLHAIAQHYASEVGEGVATFDTIAPPLSYWESKLEASQQDRYPFLVARHPNHPSPTVCGWASVSPYDSKAAYARCAEFSVYVLDAYQGHGIGRLLMEQMLNTIGKHSTIHTLISRIVPTQNASIRLHESLGFKLIGTMTAVGEKLGSLRDVAIYQYHANQTLTSS